MRNSWLSLACASALLAAVPVPADDDVKPGCAELAISALPEPDWYLDECLGGVRPVTAERG